MVNILGYLALITTVTCLCLTTPPGVAQWPDLTWPRWPDMTDTSVWTGRDMTPDMTWGMTTWPDIRVWTGWDNTPGPGTGADRPWCSVTTRGNTSLRWDYWVCLEMNETTILCFQISLSKNTIVRVLDGMPHSDWWRVETDQGSSGFYPSNYLRHI